MKKILLVINDEALTSRHAKWGNDMPYLTVFAETIEKTLTLLKEESFHAIVCGLEKKENTRLLAILEKEYPHVLRLDLVQVLSSNPISDQAFGGVGHFKQIENSEMFMILSRIVALNEKIHQPELINKVSHLQNLPTIPKIYFELNQMIKDNTSVDQIVKKLDEDPAVTGNILKLANSAFYNAQTGSILQATMYIGLINVKNIILTNAVFGETNLNPEIRDRHWQHVTLTNKLLGAFYQEVLGYPLQNNLSSVGLLHDVGSIVLMGHEPEVFNQLISQVESDNSLSLYELEKEAFGISHQELGSYLLDLWGLPFPAVEVALYHSDPLNEAIINRELVQMVYLADHYAWKLAGYNKRHVEHFERILEERMITIDGLNQLFEKMLQKI